MSADRVTDERIAGWFQTEAPDDIPHFILEAAFERTRSMPQEPGSGGVRSARRVVRSRRTTLLLLAAAVAIIAGGLVIAGVGSHAPTTTPSPSDLSQILAGAGRIRIAVRPDHPQAPVGGVATGFDADVAKEIGRRFGYQADLVIEDVATMLDPDRRTWDIALPSTADWLIDAGRFDRSTPYYHWPHRLVVPVDSRATGIQDLVVAGSICAVAGDTSESWLRGRYGGGTATAIATSVITRPTDADCLSALETGDAVGAITARLSDADLQVLADVRVIGGPDAEPRSVIVHRRVGAEPDPGRFLATLDEALDAMHRDGTLTRLSQSRFGGADLTNP